MAVRREERVVVVEGLQHPRRKARARLAIAPLKGALVLDEARCEVASDDLPPEIDEIEAVACDAAKERRGLEQQRPRAAERGVRRRRRKIERSSTLLSREPSW